MKQAETVFASRKFTVERREITGRDGRPHTYDFVVHAGAAVVVPLREDGQVVLIRNGRPAVGKDLLELPAGTLDAGESPAVCAERELQEETGYRAGRIEPLVTFYSTPGFCTEHMHVFIATQLTAGASDLEATEEIELEPLPYAEAIAAVGDGRIEDGKTIAALLYYDRFRRGQE